MNEMPFGSKLLIGVCMITIFICLVSMISGGHDSKSKKHTYTCLERGCKNECVYGSNYCKIHKKTSSYHYNSGSTHHSSSTSTHHSSNSSSSSSSSSYDDGYDSIYFDDDYDWERYDNDSDYADGVDDAMDDENW